MTVPAAFSCPSCSRDLVDKEKIRGHHIYSCTCGKRFEARRSDRKWNLKEIQKPIVKKGEKVGRPYSWGYLWSAE